MNQVGDGKMKTVLNDVSVSVSSRYDDPSEIAELEEFVERCRFRGILHYITEVFYDSKANIAAISVVDAVRVGDVVSVAISEIARETLTQFIDMDGDIQWKHNPDIDGELPVACHLLN